MKRKRPDLVVESEPPEMADAVVEEEDTYLVLSAAPDVHEPGVARLRAFHEAYTAEPAEPGSVVVRHGTPVRLLAVVHDLSERPSWREDWIARALEDVFVEVDSLKARTLAIPALGRVHGSLARERFLALLGAALRSRTPRHLERICLVVAEEDVEPFRELLGSGLWG